jgi:hypothetical protein
MSRSSASSGDTLRPVPPNARSGCAAVSVVVSVMGAPASSCVKASDRSCSTFCQASTVPSLTLRASAVAAVAAGKELRRREHCSGQHRGRHHHFEKREPAGAREGSHRHHPLDECKRWAGEPAQRE